MNGPISWYHQRFVHQRRVRVLAQHFADLIARDASVLDVGCGDGMLATQIAKMRPDISMRGIDVLVRDDPAIPVEPFDGENIPVENNGVDTILMIDVLHHTRNPEQLLCEAGRAAAKQVIVKDHFLRGFAAGRTLALMDHVGNARHGVDIPCNYLPPDRWTELYAASGLTLHACRERLGLYPPPLSWVFERSLHFVAHLEPKT